MSDRLTAEPGTVEFLKQLLEIAQDSDHPMDMAMAKVLAKRLGGTQICFGDRTRTVLIPIVDAARLADDTLNWFENGQLMIGSKSNPEHVVAWRKWNREMGVEVHGSCIYFNDDITNKLRRKR